MDFKWLRCIDQYVDVRKSTEEQEVSLNALMEALRCGEFTLEDLTYNLGDYLTSVDEPIRARGTSLLAEGTSVYKTKPLSETQLNSLAVFFASRVADKASKSEGMIGILALLERQKENGLLSLSDALMLANIVFSSAVVRDLPLTGRKAAFQAMLCLLENYKGILARMGSEVVEGVIVAIDGEKDPRCLLLTFKIIEMTAALFSAPRSVPLSDMEMEEELFDVISCYFPISFTPPPNDRIGITREQLALHLERAMVATPMFAQLAIPTVLERFSTSLHATKLDSLRLLERCWKQFGRPAVLPHVSTLWPILKKEILPPSGKELEDAVMPRGMDAAKDKAVRQAALSCLTESVRALDRVDDLSEVIGAVYDNAERNELVAMVMADDFITDMYKDVEETEALKGAAAITKALTQHSSVAAVGEIEKGVIASSSLIAALIRALSPTSAKSIVNCVCVNLIRVGGWEAFSAPTSISPTGSTVHHQEDMGETDSQSAISSTGTSRERIYVSISTPFDEQTEGSTSSGGGRLSESGSNSIVDQCQSSVSQSHAKMRCGGVMALQAINIILDSARQTAWDAMEAIEGMGNGSDGNGDNKATAVMTIDRELFKKLLEFFVRAAEEWREDNIVDGEEEASWMEVAVNGLRILGSFPLVGAWMEYQTQIAETLVDLMLGRRLMGPTSSEVESLKICGAHLARLCSDMLVEIDKAGRRVMESDAVRRDEGEGAVAMAVKRLLRVVEQAKDVGGDVHMENVEVALQALSKFACSSLEAHRVVLPTLRKMLEDILIPAMTSGEGSSSKRFIGAILRALGEYILPNCGQLDKCDHISLGDLVRNILRTFFSLAASRVMVPDQIISATLKTVQGATRICNGETQYEIVRYLVSSYFELQSKEQIPDRLGVPSYTTKGDSALSDPDNSHNATDVARREVVPASGMALPSSSALASESDGVRFSQCVQVMGAVLMSLRQEVEIPRVWDVLRMLTRVCSRGRGSHKDHIIVAMAMASILNKMEEANLRAGVEIVLKEELLPQIEDRKNEESVEELRRLRHVIDTVAYVGKGLAMRGHIELGTVVSKLMKVLQTGGKREGEEAHEKDVAEEVRREHDAVMRAAAKGFGLIISESMEGLNKSSHAIEQVLYKQKVFTSTLMPLRELLRATESTRRYPIYLAFAHMLKEAPSAIPLLESSKVFPLLLETLSSLITDRRDKGLLEKCVLSLSAFLMDHGQGKETALEHLPSIVTQLLPLVHYQQSMLVRETAIECLQVIAGFPHALIYPHRSQVIRALKVALDDKKRSVRKTAVACHMLWLRS